VAVKKEKTFNAEVTENAEFAGKSGNKEERKRRRAEKANKKGWASPP
jgi:hypothetical protein